MEFIASPNWLTMAAEVCNLLKGLPFDAQGHEFGRDVPGGRIRFIDLNIQEMAALEKILKGKKKGEIRFCKGSYETECFVCGKKVALSTDGSTIFAAAPCPYPDGIPLEFELNVPSGVMVVANGLPRFGILGNYNVNTTIGCVKTTKAMETIGCAYAYVGNTCPGMYRVGDNRFIIASGGTGEGDDDEPIDPPGEHVGGIITDLWWYSIVDLDEFKRRGLKEDRRNYDFVATKPGVYKFTHFVHLKSFEWDCKKPEIYTEIEWVRSPDPVKDYRAKFMAKNFTAGQVVSHMIKSWPGMYSGPDYIMRAADFVFCVIGGGGSWHPNGFVIFDPDMLFNTPEVEIPVFDKPFSWYPLSEKYSKLCCAAGIGEKKINLNPSFAALAKNVAYCIAKHGNSPSGGDPDPEKTSARNKAIAQKCLEKLLEKYPD